MCRTLLVQAHAKLLRKQVAGLLGEKRKQIVGMIQMQALPTVIASVANILLRLECSKSFESQSMQRHEQRIDFSALHTAQLKEKLLQLIERLLEMSGIHTLNI